MNSMFYFFKIYLYYNVNLFLKTSKFIHFLPRSLYLSFYSLIVVLTWFSLCINKSSYFLLIKSSSLRSVTIKNDSFSLSATLLHHIPLGLTSNNHDISESIELTFVFGKFFFDHLSM